MGYPFGGSQPSIPRKKRLADLRELLTYDHLGAWGMEALIDTLHALIPDLKETSADAGHSHSRDN